jgi:hypothetical protein
VYQRKRIFWFFVTIHLFFAVKKLAVLGLCQFAVPFSILQDSSPYLANLSQKSYTMLIRSLSPNLSPIIQEKGQKLQNEHGIMYQMVWGQNMAKSM